MWIPYASPSLQATANLLVAEAGHLYRARTGVKLGTTGAPDGEEARALLLAWEELGPLLDYVPEDGEWQAVMAMRDLLRELYADKQPRGDLRAAEVARAYRAHCCKEAC